jgi:hypothetical protein
MSLISCFQSLVFSAFVNVADFVLFFQCRPFRAFCQCRASRAFFPMSSISCFLSMSPLSRFDKITVSVLCAYLLNIHFPPHGYEFKIYIHGWYSVVQMLVKRQDFIHCAPDLRVLCAQKVCDTSNCCTACDDELC